MDRRAERRRGAIALRRQAVERAETYVREHIETPVPLSRLCRIVGLSERGLRNAFYGVRGMSPTRCFLAGRLEGVRKALRESWAITVTDAATSNGFYELGRFAATYREAFGETPSETLRRNRRRAATEYTNVTRAHQCLHEFPD